MSLINEALKKAQKQRTGDTPSLTAMPAIGGESASRIARRGKPAGFNTLILWIGVGVAALAVVIIGAIFVLRRPATPPALPAPSPVTTVAAPVVAPQPVEATPAPVTSPPALVVASQLPVTAAAPPPSTTLILTPVEPTPPADTTPIRLAPEPVEPARPATPAVARKLEPRAINFVNSIRVAGIRYSTNDSKVLMNDRVYRIGDTVEAEMGLRLTAITPNSLTFEDENGGKFTRNF